MAKIAIETSDIDNIMHTSSKAICLLYKMHHDVIYYMYNVAGGDVLSGFILFTVNGGRSQQATRCYARMYGKIMLTISIKFISRYATLACQRRRYCLPSRDAI